MSQKNSNQATDSSTTITMTFDEYDEIFAKMDSLPKATLIPTLNDLKRVKVHFDKFYLFAIYLSECHEEVEDPEDAAYISALKTIVREQLVLVE